jgi:hypothetical protein
MENWFHLVTQLRERRKHTVGAVHAKMDYLLQSQLITVIL